MFVDCINLSANSVIFLFSVCKPRLIKFLFHYFMRLIIKGGVYFFFLYLMGRYRKRSVFPWLRFVDQTLFLHSVLFSITCTSVTGGNMMMNIQGSCIGISIITRVANKNPKSASMRSQSLR